ncbi:hypothetical protein JCM4814A_90290 [Streptomyces phaeofaciens JCM 4814]
MITSDVLVAVLAVLIAMPFAQNSSERLVVAMLAMTADYVLSRAARPRRMKYRFLDHSDRQNPHCHCHSHSRSRSRSRSRDRHRTRFPAVTSALIAFGIKAGLALGVMAGIASG